MAVEPLIGNNSANRLLAGGFGKDAEGALKPLGVDELGKPFPSPQNLFSIRASGLSIRPLSHETDSAAIVGSGIGIRPLRAEEDSVAVASQASAFSSASSPVGLFVPVYFLPTDVSRMRQNAFVVANRALLSLSVRIVLQIAPVDDDDYYVNDGASYDLVGGGVQTFIPSKLMRFARIRVSALLSTATVEVYYFGRS